MSNKQSIEPNWQSCWEITGIRDSSTFFRSLPLLLREGAVLYFEGTSIANTIKVYLQAHSVPTSHEIAKGTIWPKSATFHVPFSSGFIEKFATLADNHAEPELFDHMHAYSGTQFLCIWFDSFHKPFYVAPESPEAAVKEFCLALSAQYELISKAG